MSCCRPRESVAIWTRRRQLRVVPSPLGMHVSLPPIQSAPRCQTAVITLSSLRDSLTDDPACSTMTLASGLAEDGDGTNQGLTVTPNVSSVTAPTPGTPLTPITMTRLPPGT